MKHKELINRVNSKEWVKANSTTNSHLYREAFIKKYGGIFEKIGNAWKWNEKVPTKEEPTKMWIFHKADGGTFVVTNFMEFCRNHELNKSAMYEVMGGKRKSHKGFIKVEKLI